MHVSVVDLQLSISVKTWPAHAIFYPSKTPPTVRTKPPSELVPPGGMVQCGGPHFERPCSKWRTVCRFNSGIFFISCIHVNVKSGVLDS